MTLFAKAEKRAFVRSLGLSEQVIADQQPSATTAVLASISKTFQARASQQRMDIEETAEHLITVTHNRFNTLKTEMTQQLKHVSNLEIRSIVGKDEEAEKRAYHRVQIIEAAKKLEYFANLYEFHSWVLLRMEDRQNATQFEMLFSMHVLGREYRGFFACSLVGYWKERESDDGRRIARDIQPLVDAPFEFTDIEPVEKLENRFKVWLENGLIAGLSAWSKGI